MLQKFLQLLPKVSYIMFWCLTYFLILLYGYGTDIVNNKSTFDSNYYFYHLV